MLKNMGMSGYEVIVVQGLLLHSELSYPPAVPLITKLDVIPTYSFNENSQLLEIPTKFTDSMVC